MGEYLNIVPLDVCTGCASCVNSCPKGCISMRIDDYGFSYPYVEKTNCISCDICIKSCPIENQTSHENVGKFFVCKHQDENVRIASSSGGFFTALADKILADGGVVCGAAYSNDYRSVAHCLIYVNEELKKLRCSKYVQSEIGFCYQEIKKELKKEVPVLFTGTPCQIAGLKSYLKRPFANLLCVDVICHGVPNPKIYQEYLDYLQRKYQSEILSVNFREKIPGKKGYNTAIRFSNGFVLREEGAKNAYMRGFIHNLYIRSSCTHCQFKDFSSGSDLTMGDFWGADTLGGEYAKGGGYSIVVLNTLRGVEFFNDLTPVLKDVKEVDKATGLLFNTCSLHSVSHHPKRDVFYQTRKVEDFEGLIDSLLKEKLSFKQKLKACVISKKNVMKRFFCCR